MAFFWLRYRPGTTPRQTVEPCRVWCAFETHVTDGYGF
jgi:hypothetical protein